MRNVDGRAPKPYLVVDENLQILGTARTSTLAGGLALRPEDLAEVDVEGLLSSGHIDAGFYRVALGLVDRWAQTYGVIHALKCRDMSIWWSVRHRIIWFIKRYFQLEKLLGVMTANDAIAGVLCSEAGLPRMQAIPHMCERFGLQCHAIAFKSFRRSRFSEAIRLLGEMVHWIRGKGQWEWRRVRDFRSAQRRLLFFVPHADRTILSRSGHRQSRDAWAGPLLERAEHNGYHCLKVSIPHRTLIGKGAASDDALSLGAYAIRVLLGTVAIRTFVRWVMLSRQYVRWRRKIAVTDPLDELIAWKLDREVRTDLAQMPLAIEVSARLLEHTRPQVVITFGEHSRTVMALLSEAHRRSIPTVALQHGFLYVGHTGYTFPENARSLGLPVAKKTLVFGRLFSDFLLQAGCFRPEDVVVTGLGRLDYYRGFRWGDVRQETRAALGVRPDDIVLLYTGHTDDAHAVNTVLQLLQIDSRIRVIIKLHPTPQKEFRADSEPSAPGLFLFREEYDLYELLSACDLHIDFFSTVLFESRLFNVPAVILEKPTALELQQPDWFGAPVVPRSKLVDWVKAWMNDRGASKYDRGAPDVAMHWPREPISGLQLKVVEEVLKGERANP